MHVHVVFMVRSTLCVIIGIGIAAKPPQSIHTYNLVQHGEFQGAPYTGGCRKEYIDILLRGGLGAPMGLSKYVRSIFEGEGDID